MLAAGRVFVEAHTHSLQLDSAATVNVCQTSDLSACYVDCLQSAVPAHVVSTFSVIELKHLACVCEEGGSGHLQRLRQTMFEGGWVDCEGLGGT